MYVAEVYAAARGQAGLCNVWKAGDGGGSVGDDGGGGVVASWVTCSLSSRLNGGCNTSPR